MDEQLVQFDTFTHYIREESNENGHFIVPKLSKIPKECWGAICSSRLFTWYIHKPYKIIDEE